MVNPKDWSPGPESGTSPRVRAMWNRIDNAIANANAAFWREIVKEFPDVKWGDYPAEGESQWQEAMGKALLTWLNYNHPKTPTLETVLRMASLRMERKK